MPRHPSLQTGPVFVAQLNRAPTPLAFSARTPAAARTWRNRTRSELRRTLLDAIPWRSCPLQPKRLQQVDRGDFIREKWLLCTSPGVFMPVYILRQKSSRGKQPTILAFHGHGYGAKDTVGLWEDGSERYKADGYQKDFAIALCRQGFVVAVPEIACFGERVSDFSYLNGQIGQSAPSTCQHAAMIAFHLGGSVLGLRMHEGLRLVDWLFTRADVDSKRIGAMGISGGGMHTLFSACLDERIQASVISGYVSDMRDSIFGMHHCPCNYVPGLSRFGDIADLLGLIAPRPVLVQAADHDPIFPIAGVKRTVATARRHFRQSGAAGFPETEYFEGRHEIGGEAAYAFLARHLRPC